MNNFHCSCDIQWHRNNKLELYEPDWYNGDCIELLKTAKRNLKFIELAYKREKDEDDCYEDIHTELSIPTSVTLLKHALKGSVTERFETFDVGGLDRLKRDMKTVVSITEGLMRKELKKHLPLFPDVVLARIVQFLDISNIYFVDEFQDKDLIALNKKVFGLYQSIYVTMIPRAKMTSFELTSKSSSSCLKAV